MKESKSILDCEKIAAFIVGVVAFFVLFSVFSCSSPEPKVEAIDYQAYNDSIKTAVLDSLFTDSVEGLTIIKDTAK